MKILIIRFSSIGDIVLTTPVIRCIRKQMPSAKIHYLTKKQFASILETNPYLDKVHLLNEKFSDTMDELKQEKFDVILDLHKNLRTLRVKNSLGVSSHSFGKLNIEKWLITNFKINRLPDIHIVDRYLQTAATLKIENDGEGLDYFIPENAKVDFETLPGEISKGYVCVVIGAAHATKKLPPAKVVEVINRISKPVILIGGKADFDEGEEIRKNASGFVVNTCGQYNLHQSASIVQQSSVVLSNDTGFMHIAAALKKPVVAVWGNTIPEFGMYPYYGDHKIPTVNFEVKNLPCRPCSKIGYDHCPKKHFKCMLEQDTSGIALRIEQLTFNVQR
ncbi:glycosyltransferase family 9 protein [Pollutibacter soli]|uniref:glycosyltransferase family 9 protein n=1 Tax=Pollutibacter soli TaxID=3034157 RepID=UPI003013828A